MVCMEGLLGGMSFPNTERACAAALRNARRIFLVRQHRPFDKPPRHRTPAPIVRRTETTEFHTMEF